MTESNPLVSIVLPTYNRANWLAGSIESCLNQSYKNIELIVVNDGSSDATEEIVQEFIEKDNRVRYLKKPNGGLPKALNHGFQYAKGKYFTWTSDDNLYDKDAIEIMVTALEKSVSSKLVYCNYQLIDEDGTIIGVVSRPLADKIFKQPTIGACFLYNAECAREIGGYDHNWILVEDTEFFIRFALKFSIMHLDGVQPYYYRIGSHSLSTTHMISIRFLNAKLMSKCTNLLLKKMDIYSKCYYDCALWLLKKEKTKLKAILYIFYSLLLNPFRLKSWFLAIRLAQPKWIKKIRTAQK